MTLVAADVSRSAVLTDPDRAREVFQRQLPGYGAAGLQIDRCAILHTRYRSSPEDALGGKAFLSVSYQLEVSDPARITRGEQVIHLKAYPPGKSPLKFERARRERRAHPRFGEAVAHLPELDAVVWSFPNDPKLAHLPAVVDPQSVRSHLPYRHLPSGLNSASSVREVQVEIVRYKPEVRCTTRYLLQPANAAIDRRVIYGKTFGHRRAAEISRRMNALWTQCAPGEGRFTVARPLGFGESVRTVWQDALPGVPLTRVIGPHNYVDLLRQAAAGLVRFHRAELAGLPASDARDDLGAVRADVTEMALAFPGHARGLNAVFSTLERSLASLEPQAGGLVHGDFLLKQLVLHQGRLGLCDFDNLTIGDPMRDLANFVVDLQFQDLDPALVDEMAATFLSAYAARSTPLPRRRLQWQCGLHLLRGAHYFYKRRHGMPAFDGELARILRLAQQSGFHA